MALSIEESVQVATSPGVVWKLLSDPRTWMLWWPSCLEAEALDKKRLRDGSKLRLVLQPSFLRFGVTATVEVATPERALLWRGAAWGVEGRHAFYLEPRANGTLVREQETFSGPALPLLRLFGQAGATRRMFRENLRGLKRLAEKAV